MSLKFRRRVKILPGIYLNLGKNGISTTIGPRGANINICKNGVYLNTGIPGSGISNREKIFNAKTKVNENDNPLPDEENPSSLLEGENSNDIITSEGLTGLKEQLEEAIKERDLIALEIKNVEKKLNEIDTKLSRKQKGFFSIFYSKESIEENEIELKNTKDEYIELTNQSEESKADINIEFDKDIEEQYKLLSNYFSEVTNSNLIWDITAELPSMDLKSSAKATVLRKVVNFKWDSLDFIKSSHQAFHLENAYGSDLYIYPAFIILINEQNQVTLIDLKELKFSFKIQRFLEQNDSMPTDTKIVDYAWEKSNKDGSRDLRFLDNHQNPVIEYGAFNFQTTNGLNETYYISNVEAAENFANSFKKYLGLLNRTSDSSEKSSTNLISNPTYEFLPDSLDNLTYDAGILIVNSQIVSTSLLQRRLKLGYNRAERILSQLEQLGIVGTKNASEVREVLIKDIESLEVIFEKHKNFLMNKEKSKDSRFTKEYFDLLESFIPEININLKKLIDDENLRNKLEKKIRGISLKEFIEYCVCYDFVQLLKMISNGQIDPKGLETFGLVFLSGRIIEKLASTAIPLKYDLLRTVFSNGAYQNVAESLIKMGEEENPLKTFLENTEKKFDNNLSLAIFLKINNNPLFDEYANFLYRFAIIIAKADSLVSEGEQSLIKDLHINILKEAYQVTHTPIHEIKNNLLNITTIKENESLEDVLSELDGLIGLEAVKQEIKSLINYIKIQKEREKLGLKSTQISYHCVFTGSPGTGKTTIARIVAKIYMHLGILKKGQLVETDRSGLIAEYSGQTAIKVNKTIDTAIDGILFIDEAYSLIGENRDDFGKEAVATLIKRIEDDRDKLVVILAGYTDEMKNFIEVNPGLKSRFNRYIEFVDYSPQDLAAIFKLNCRKLEYILTEDADKKLMEIVTKAFSNRDKSFGNGRFARNLFEKVIENQANRIAMVPVLTKEILVTIESEDLLNTF